MNSSTWECKQMPNFRGRPNKDLCKLGKEYVNDLLCKFGPFCLQHSKTFDISHVFLLATIAQLSTLKQVRFLAHPVYANSSLIIVTKHNKRSNLAIKMLFNFLLLHRFIFMRQCFNCKVNIVQTKIVCYRHI